MAQLLKVDFEGRSGPLLKLSIWTAVLTALSLGFYRFWMKTRLRRHFWSAVRPDRTPLEYVGKGVEKFAGFLIALVILAFLIGVVALVLVYLSYAVFQGETEAYFIAAALAVPLIYFASYRAKRYVYARTRWRGIRFGLEPAAGKYALTAVGNLLLAIVSLGALWPRMTFKLEKFRTDRTWFGTQKLHQGGRWTDLIKPFLPVLVPIWVILGLAVYGYVLTESLPLDEIAAAEVSDSDLIEMTDDGTVDALLGIAWILPSMMLLALLASLAYLRYRVIAYRKLTSQKTAGGVGLISTASFPRVFWLNVKGYFLVNIFTALATIALTLVASGILMVVFPGLAEFGFDISDAVIESTAMDGDGMPSPLWATVFAIFIYMITLLFFAVFRQTFVLFPIWQHYAETLTITGGEHLAEIGQRDRDEAAEAEGMAEAFDLGAAI